MLIPYSFNQFHFFFPKWDILKFKERTSEGLSICYQKNWPINSFYLGIQRNELIIHDLKPGAEG